ncbi:MAG: biotin synthase BioB [Candidatus Aureabacteria bacterium]|nr:biotin synthase BioB [Candidatus Auribacterota bacterium]
MLERINKLTWEVLNGSKLSRQHAQMLLKIDGQPEIIALLSSANMIRQRFKGDKIDLCSIINAKSGWCPEDCKFCAQSARYNTNIEKFPLINCSEIVSGAKRANARGANRFGIVTSGRRIKSKKELEQICESIKMISKDVNINRCASLGSLDEESALMLKEAGLHTYHHNLEMAEGFFPNICTTHTYQERLKTIAIAKEAGLQICCGGIFGLGEGISERVEFAFALRDLDVDMVPLNFLNPIRGTPLENMPLLPPLEILKIIALFRFVLPDKHIKVGGGREKNLRSLQPLMYLAGANGTMIGDYLTTKGRDPEEDILEIIDLGLQPVNPVRIA